MTDLTPLPGPVSELSRDDLRTWCRDNRERFEQGTSPLAGYTKLTAPQLRKLVADVVESAGTVADVPEVEQDEDEDEPNDIFFPDYDAPAEDDEQVQVQLDEIDAGTFHRPWIVDSTKLDLEPLTFSMTELAEKMQQGISVTARIRPALDLASRALNGLPPYDPFRPDPQAFINSRTPRRMLAAGHR